MAYGDAQGIHALALHKAHKFLTEKNRRLLDASGDLIRLAHILLGADYDAVIKEASAESSSQSPETLLTFADADYPPLLKEINYAPFALYLKGKRSLLNGNFVSLVGTREPSAAGRVAAARLAKIYAGKNHTIVSGIARGVDGIAHRSALEAAGNTIAILANGCDHLYPLENRDLYEAAVPDGHLLLLSEYPPKQKPQKHHFVRRNRLIAGFSPLTIFVEGDIKSGGMITVNHALAEGRDVAALAHPALERNAGGEKLISEGAPDLTSLVFPSGTFQGSA